MTESLYRRIPLIAAALSWAVAWLVCSCSRRHRDQIIAELRENRRTSTANTNRVLREQPDARALAAWAVTELERTRRPLGVVNLDRRR